MWENQHRQECLCYVSASADCGEAEAAVVQGPDAGAEYFGAQAGDYFVHLLLRCWKALEDFGGEHFQPIFHRVFAFDRCRAIEEPSLSNFDTVFFEHRGVFADSAEEPRAALIGGRAENIAQRFEN